MEDLRLEIWILDSAYAQNTMVAQWFPNFELLSFFSFYFFVFFQPVSPEKGLCYESPSCPYQSIPVQANNLYYYCDQNPASKISRDDPEPAHMHARGSPYRLTCCARGFCNLARQPASLLAIATTAGQGRSIRATRIKIGMITAATELGTLHHSLGLLQIHELWTFDRCLWSYHSIRTCGCRSYGAGDPSTDRIIISSCTRTVTVAYIQYKMAYLSRRIAFVISNAVEAVECLCRRC